MLEAEHLAPHGVPGGFKPRALSRRNSQEENQQVLAQPNPMDDPGLYEEALMQRYTHQTQPTYYN